MEMIFDYYLYHFTTIYQDAIRHLQGKLQPLIIHNKIINKKKKAFKVSKQLFSELSNMYFKNT